MWQQLEVRGEKDVNTHMHIHVHTHTHLPPEQQAAPTDWKMWQHGCVCVYLSSYSVFINLSVSSLKLRKQMKWKSDDWMDEWTKRSSREKVRGEFEKEGRAVLTVNIWPCSYERTSHHTHTQTQIYIYSCVNLPIQVRFTVMWPQFKHRCFCFVLLDRIESDFGEMCYQILKDFFFVLFCCEEKVCHQLGVCALCSG